MHWQQSHEESCLVQQRLICATNSDEILLIQTNQKKYLRIPVWRLRTKVNLQIQ